MKIPRFFPFVIAGLGLVLLIASISLLALTGMVGSASADLPLPENLVGLPLAEHISGDEAIADINNLHGKAFPMTGGVVATYGASQEITLWVSLSPNKAGAVDMLVDMRDRIAEGNSPFLLIETRQDGGREIFVLEGLGQMHYYFQSGRRVVWLAADAPLADAALQQAVALYP